MASQIKGTLLFWTRLFRFYLKMNSHSESNLIIKKSLSTPEALDRRAKVLGLNDYQPKTKYICFLPFRGEFGWYIQTFVKRVHGYNHSNKIVCTKQGHECLFPTATSFFYEWKDIPDNQKAGVLADISDIPEIQTRVLEYFKLSRDEVTFLYSTESAWEEKLSLADISFIPNPKNLFGLNVDIVITPRNRQIDSQRNWTRENWQYLIDKLVTRGFTVGVCGARDSSFQLHNIKHYSYDYLDVNSDVELMLNAKAIVTQESGLLYLAFLCEKPIFVIDYYMGNMGSDLHRQNSTMLIEFQQFWNEPIKIYNEIIKFLE